MKYKILLNGDLEISFSDDTEFSSLREVKADRGDEFASDDVMYELFERLIANSELQWSRPEYIGALTSAPILAIYGEPRKLKLGENVKHFNLFGHWNNATWVQDVVKAWGYMNYQIRSPQEDMLKDGFVIFQKGK